MVSAFALRKQHPHGPDVNGPQKKSIRLEFPTRIVLTEDGVSFFLARSRSLHRFDTADGGARFGFNVRSAEYAWLKRLIAAGFAEKIELQIPDAHLSKSLLEDAFRLVFFSMLRRRVALSALERAYDSTLIRSWNRSNPKRAIGPDARLNDRVIRSCLERSPQAVAASAQALRGAVAERLRPLPLHADEQRRSRLFADEAIAAIDPIVAFVLIGAVGRERAELHAFIAEAIAESIRRADIADLTAFMGTELAAAAERSALVRALDANGGEVVRRTLEDAHRRQAIMESGDYRGSTIVFTFPRASRGLKRRLRFRLSVYNDGADLSEERRLMEDFSDRSAAMQGGKRLEELFGSASGVYGDDGLCFYYLGILSEECRRRGVVLESHLRKAGGSVVTTLSFGL